MRIILFILFVLIGLNGFANPPIFTDSIENAQKISTDLKIPIFVIVSADWCLYCNKLDNQISDNLETFDNIIIVKLDYDKDIEFVKKNNIKKIPTIIYQGNKYVGKYDIIDLKNILAR